MQRNSGRLLKLLPEGADEGVRKYFKIAGKFVLLPLALLLAGAFLSASYLINSAKSLNSDGNWFETANGIDEASFVSLGGVKQYVRIRSRNSGNPVLLDLHGGPGAPQTAWSHRLLRPLTEYYTLVEWDQRGAGRSAGDVTLVKTMSYDQMVDDTIALIEHLQKRLKTDKVVLVGHSWGAMLGLGVIKKRPDLIHAYVGVGQALAWPSGFDETKRLLIEAADKAGDSETSDSLRRLPKDWPPQEDVDGLLERIQIIQAPMEKYGTSLHASKSNSVFKGDLLLDIITSPEIGLLEASNMLEANAATKALMADLYGRDLRRDLGTEYQVPMFIFQGEHDWQTPTSLVRPWFETLSAPHKAYIPFEQSAHIVVNEEPGKFLYEMVNRVRPFALAN